MCLLWRVKNPLTPYTKRGCFTMGPQGTEANTRTNDQKSLTGEKIRNLVSTASVVFGRTEERIEFFELGNSYTEDVRLSHDKGIGDLDAASGRKEIVEARRREQCHTSFRMMAQTMNTATRRLGHSFTYSLLVLFPMA